MADVTDHGNLDDSQAAEQENYWYNVMLLLKMFCILFKNDK